MTPAPHIALLRGINVGGRNRVPMGELRAICEDLGWQGVLTYIQSGNLVFRASGPIRQLESSLEKAVEDAFGISVAIIVRSADAWRALIRANPFPEAAADQPNRVLLCVSKDPPRPGAAEALQVRATFDERVIEAAASIWIHYPSGVGTSKLTPALLDRLVGSPVTARNWNTVLKLDELAST